jgi:hypothetical protein
MSGAESTWLLNGFVWGWRMIAFSGAKANRGLLASRWQRKMTPLADMAT